MSPRALWSQRTAFLSLLPANFSQFLPLKFDKNLTAKGIEEKCNEFLYSLKEEKQSIFVVLIIEKKS